MSKFKHLKFLSILASVFVLVISVCGIIIGSVSAADTNLVPTDIDAGFENGNGFIRHADNVLTTSTYRSGSSSLKLPFSSSNWGFLFNNIPTSIFKDGSTYKIGLYVKTENLADGKYELVFKHADNDVVSTKVYVPEAADWTEISHTFTYSSSLNQSFIFGIQPISANNAVIYVDDFFIYDITETYEDESDDNLLKQFGCKGNMEAAAISDLGLTAGGGVSIVSEEKHGGKYSLKFDTGAPSAWGFLYMNLDMTAYRGETFKVSLWAKSANVTGPLGINVFDNKNNKEIFDSRVVIEQSSDWKYYESIFTVGDTTETVNIGIQPFGSVSGVIYVDDIMLTKVVTPDYEDDAPNNVLNKFNIKGNMEAPSLSALGFLNSNLNKLSTAEKRSGLQSLEVVFDNNNNVGWGFIAKIDNTDELIGKSYRFSLWAKSADVTGDVGLVIKYNNSKDVVPPVKVSRSNDWVKYQVEFKVTDEMLLLSLGLQPFGSNFSGTVYVDDVMLEQIDDIDDDKGDNGNKDDDKDNNNKPGNGNNPKTGEALPLAVASLALVSGAVLVSGKKNRIR